MYTRISLKVKGHTGKHRIDRRWKHRSLFWFFHPEIADGEMTN